MYRCKASTLNGANTVGSPVAWGFSGIVARFCLSFCGTCLSLITVAQLRQYGQRWPLCSPLCVSSLEYVGRLQKAVRGFCVAPRKETHGGGAVASGSGFPGIVRRGSDLCNTWKGKAPVGVVGICCVFPSCVLASAPRSGPAASSGSGFP